jgi:DNA-3-methyladenine glycosylase
VKEQMLVPRFFDRPAATVAAELIGCVLTVNGVGGVIVETEAYDGTDPASHSVNGPTPRNAVMFGPPGHAYVYRSYGLHWCLNFVCEPAGNGAAVLIRALEPTTGIEAMAARRGTGDLRKLCAGPGRLCQALAVDRSHNGMRLDAPPFAVLPAVTPPKVMAGTRIGITRGVDTVWRFGRSGSRYLSRPFPDRSATGK